MPLIFDDIVEVVLIATVFPRDVGLSDAPSRIMLDHMVIWTSRRCSFASSMPCPIVVTDRRFPPRNTSQLLCDDEVRRLSPFMSQLSEFGHQMPPTS
jgi:hypothetical protein